MKAARRAVTMAGEGVIRFVLFVNNKGFTRLGNAPHPSGESPGKQPDGRDETTLLLTRQVRTERAITMLGCIAGDDVGAGRALGGL
jgi:hypothetical protein